MKVICSPADRVLQGATANQLRMNSLYSTLRKRAHCLAWDGSESGLRTDCAQSQSSRPRGRETGSVSNPVVNRSRAGRPAESQLAGAFHVFFNLAPDWRARPGSVEST